MELMEQIEKQRGSSAAATEISSLRQTLRTFWSQKERLQAEKKALLEFNIELMQQNEKWTRLAAELKIQKKRFEQGGRVVLEKGARAVNDFWSSVSTIEK